MSHNKEFIEQEVLFLFKDARDKLDRIDEDANKSKTVVVIKLAKDLEGKIPTDSICNKIVEQLDGKISPSLIRECLPKKYKQEYRVKNAKQKKLSKEIKLATPPLLNQKEYQEVETEEEEKQKDKVAVIVGAGGREYIQRDKEDEEPLKTTTEDHPDSAPKDKVSTRSSSSPQQLEQEHQFKEHDDRLDGKPEGQSFNYLDDQSSVQEKILDKPNQLLTTTADEIVNTSGISSASSSFDNKYILSFEFSMPFRYLQDHLNSIHSNIDDDGKVWFNGRMNTKTGEIIFTYIGRMNQQNVAEKSSRNDTATAYTTGDRENGQ